MERLLVQMTIRADQVQPGDITIDLPVEKDYVIAQIMRVVGDLVPTEIVAAGGWVNLMGDTPDGYYMRWYESVQAYYAAPDQGVTVVRDLARFVSARDHGAHHHGLDTLVGYAVRETIANGEVIRGGGGRVGRDVATVFAPSTYADALSILERYRSQRDGYAVVDHLYACGCRGGI